MRINFWSYRKAIPNEFLPSANPENPRFVRYHLYYPRDKVRPHFLLDETLHEDEVQGGFLEYIASKLVNAYRSKFQIVLPPLEFHGGFDGFSFDVDNFKVRVFNVSPNVKAEIIGRRTMKGLIFNHEYDVVRYRTDTSEVHGEVTSHERHDFNATLHVRLLYELEYESEVISTRQETRKN